MASPPRVILSGFADEAANHKTAVEQFCAFAALGLQYFSIRFIDVGSGVKNVMQLTKSEIQKVRHLMDEYGLNVSSLGSPIGKVKLEDVDDGTSNAYVPFKRYLSKDVQKACELAHAFEAKLIRGFSFYHPKGTDPWEHLPKVVDQLGQVAETCHRSDLTFGLEVEANLVGQDGRLLAELHRQVNHPAMVLVFDAANLICQGFTPAETFEHYELMKPGLGWLHIKDYHSPTPLKKSGHVDEDVLANFVPADLGDARSDPPRLRPAVAHAGAEAQAARHPGRIPRSGAARQRRRPVRRLQRPGRHGRRPARPVPRARLHGNRVPPARLRGHTRGAGVLTLFVYA
jgi:sugar phosphate isomerase/epimerase